MPLPETVPEQRITGAPSRRNIRFLRAGGLTAAALSLAALITASPARPQTVSCVAAAKPAEFAICNSEKLQLLDEHLSQVLARQLDLASNGSQRRRLEAEQAEWLRQRDACGADFDCLDARYGLRLDELSGKAGPVPITRFKRFAETGSSR